MAMTNSQIKEAVRREYGRLVEGGGSCCSGCCGDEGRGAYLVEKLGYAPEQLEGLPEGAVESAFGCGNPHAFAGVQEGDVVLDIGSGAGIDCLIAAQRVGPRGKVIGLDMTPAMIARATENALEAGLENVEFRLGDAEDMPVEDASVDWVISNCVINLAPDKEKVFREVYRVLRPGGQVAISDIVLGDELPEEVAASVEALVGCVSGAIREGEYLEAMRLAGLADVEVVERLVYDEVQLEGLLGGEDELSSLWARHCERIAGKVWSARLRARKP
jgi:SAM-dependent methyltransferase